MLTLQVKEPVFSWGKWVYLGWKRIAKWEIQGSPQGRGKSPAHQTKETSVLERKEEVG